MQGQGPPGGYPPNPYGQPNPYDQQQQPQGYGGQQQPQGYGGQQQPQNNYSQGTFDMGGGQQLRVKINGQTPENYLKNRASGMVWGWIIGLGVVAVLVIGGGILGIYVYVKAKDGVSDIPGAAAAAKAASWDGKSPLTCGGNDHIAITNVTATAGIVAGGNCHVVMSNVNITAPVAIEAGGNADVVFTGGSINGSTNAIKAGGNAKVTFAGTKVTGKQDKAGNAKILGI